MQKRYDMSVIEKDSMPFKPYARLMNILGDQLITDKIVAVIELLKNCYDADSPSAEVRFGNMCNIGFNDLPLDQQAYIEIRDFGTGMTLQTIKNVWLRPATPDKLNKKKQKLSKTSRGRVIQGEKGIGRFAIHKLGEKIELYTKAKGDNEIKLLMDFSDYDPDNINLFNQKTSYKLLEDVKNVWYVNNPPELLKYESGTIIRIYHLREHWKDIDYKNLYKNIQRLIPPIDKNADSLGIKIQRDFNISMFVDDVLFTSEDVMTFDDVIDRAQFIMIGAIDNNYNIKFKYTSKLPQRILNETFNLMDNNALSQRGYSLTGIKEIENYGRKPLCGPFSFTFYAFDLKKPDRTILNDDLKRFIKDNFVYVLRDGVRVYPYGEKGVDWLDLDKKRSTIKAGQFISYNDLTGFVYISQEDNPQLRDASNRQGIVNTDGAFDDFRNLVTAATEIFNAEIKIDKYKVELQQKKHFHQTKSALSSSYEEMKNQLSRINDKDSLAAATKFISTYDKHLALVEERMRTVEDLAGLGMAVEKSSHDTLRLIILMRENIKGIIRSIKMKSISIENIIDFMSELDGNLMLVYDDLQLIQPLFKIQRKAIKNVSILASIKKVVKYFRYEINDKIKTNINEIATDFTVSTNEGAILQVLINLIDNSIYWLHESKEKDKKLFFKINQLERTIIIADNGCGVREDVAPFIFEEFVSMKADGRGLGLYIVKELLYRMNSEIYLLNNSNDKILSGANFIIKFKQEEA